MSASVAGPVGFPVFPISQSDIFPPVRRGRARSAQTAAPVREHNPDRRSAATSLRESAAEHRCERRSEVPAERSEHELIREAVAGDAEALETLFGRNRLRLYRVAFRLLRCKEDAEDAVQDALLSAYRNLAAFQGRSLFSTWLTRIVVNAALIKRRSQRAHPELFLEDATSNLARPAPVDVVDSRPDPEQILASLESHLVVEEALEKLAPAMRSAFRLRELQELSNSEAAVVSGVQMGAFKSRITRARNQLASQLDHALLVPLQKFIPAPSAPSRVFTSEESR